MRAARSGLPPDTALPSRRLHLTARPVFAATSDSVRLPCLGVCLVLPAPCWAWWQRVQAAIRRACSLAAALSVMPGKRRRSSTAADSSLQSPITRPTHAPRVAPGPIPEIVSHTQPLWGSLVLVIPPSRYPPIARGYRLAQSGAGKLCLYAGQANIDRTSTRLNSSHRR